MPAKRKTDRREAVKAMAVRGISNRFIAEALGLSITKVNYMIHTLKNEGELPDRATREGREKKSCPTIHLRLMHERFGVNKGNLRNILLGLTDQQREWLFRQTPKGSVVANVIKAIIVDAYEEETNA
jgi:transposase